MAAPDERLAALSNEAAALLEKAKQYRARMEALPPDDPHRAQLEQVIRDLLDSANSLSDAVKSSVAKY
jgi:hypothetical protein